jgi:Protein of unknown function (DUF3662)/FHA domain
MGLQGFERRLERTVEGVFSRAFKSKLKPIELGRRLVREMDDNRSIDVKGRTIVPNDFTFSLSPDEHATFQEIHDALVRELADVAREHAKDESYSFMGPISIVFEAEPALRPGRFSLESRMHEARSVAAGGRSSGAASTGTGTGGALVLPDGERQPLGQYVLVIGRLPECDIPIPDPNVSRRHAEIRPTGFGFTIADLGSTNGTRVNGVAVSEHTLVDGDVITVGGSRIRYEAT